MGINLYGPSGTGKTMAAHAIASHLQRNILIVNYADIESKFVGETPKNIRRAFEVAKETHSILFFDEADAILSRRVTSMTSATERKRKSNPFCYADAVKRLSGFRHIRY